VARDKVLTIFLTLGALLAASAASADKPLVGTGIRDSITGTPNADRILLLAGDDRGYGGRGADLIRGGGGEDRLVGGRGRDALAGSGGGDVLRGGRGADALIGGRGGDLLDARDQRRDRRVRGGRGQDVCLLDSSDESRTRGCERIAVSGRAPASAAYGIWKPSPRDTCPAWLHDTYSVIGPDGKRYPTWHPAQTTNPATGQLCYFGHEHGRDPAGSDLHDWVRSHYAAPGRAAQAGLPFGVTNEALDAFAAANPGFSTRHEDHVGHKVEWENDVQLQRTLGGDRVAIGVSCDFLVKIHQGSHSKDALGNNVHELLYAVRCSDGTALIASKLSAFGAPNSFVRSCDKSTALSAGTSHSLPSGGGTRLIPDRECVEEHLLVPSGQFSEYSLGLYEDWISSNHLRRPDGSQLAYFDPHFAVFNPSRYAAASPAGSIARVLDVCFETEPGTGDTARGGYCEEAQGYASLVSWDSPLSGFDGSQREVYFNQTEVRNPGGPTRWYTDPYGGGALQQPFPGAICQLVGSVDNSRPYPLESQAFGAGRGYTAPGVHAPN
jgi:hypothetical protein